MSPEPGPSMLLAQTSAPPVNSDTESLMFSLLLLVLLILVNAFFAASEIAVITLNDNKIKKMAEDGNKKAKSIVKLTANSSRFLATIQVGVTLSGFLTSASAAQIFAGRMTSALVFLPFSQDVIYGASVFVVTLLLSYFSLVFGELVPKKIAMQKAEALSFAFVGILNFTSKLFYPFISFLTFSTNLVLRLFGLDPNEGEEAVTEEEILMMVDAGEEKGVIWESAKTMISNIFDFSDATVGEMMTHRTDVCALPENASIQDAVRLSIERGFSRIPIYHEDLDNVLGIIYVKDLLKYVGNKLTENAPPVSALMRAAYFVPETKQCSDLFKEMTERKIQIAIIVDEYGGTEGIVTMEDMVESIVGNIQDEYDNEEEEIYRMDEHRFTVDGSTAIGEISDITGVEIPEGDYDTVAGLMMENLGNIPAPTEHPSVTVGSLIFTVLCVEDRRITKILVERMVDEPEKQAQE